MTEGKVVYTSPPFVNYSLFPTVNSSDFWDALDTPEDIEYSDVGGDSFWDSNVDLGIRSITAGSVFTDYYYSDDGSNMFFWDGANNEIDLMHNLEGDEWNISAAYFFGDGRYITGINASLINLSLADHNLLNNLNWSLSGHIIDTNLDMDNYDISNIDQAYFSGTDSISSDDNNHLDLHANYIDLHGNLSTIWEVYIQGDGDGSGGDVHGELVFGSRDAMIYYNGSDFIIDPDILGSGDVVIAGNLRTEGGLVNGINLSNLSDTYVPYTGADRLVDLGGENVTTTGTGFFGYIGSIISRITKGWFDELDVDGNVTAGLFKGKFNWTTNDSMLDFDGSVLGLNRVDFNYSVQQLLAVTYYNASEVTLEEATDGGVLSDTYIYDGISYNLTETAGAPGFDVRFNFTGVSDFNAVIIRMKMDGRDHEVNIQLWDDVLNDWENYATIIEVEEYQVIELGVFDSTDHINGADKVQLRIYMADPGNTNHEYFFDWIQLANGPATFSTQEIDPLSHHKGKNLNLSNNNLTTSDSIKLTNGTTTWRNYVDANGTLVWEVS